MFRPNPEQVRAILTGIIFVQSGLALELAFALKRRRDDVGKYLNIIKYYNTVLEREQVHLTDYDIIVLMTMFEENEG